jgi:hypothetical protein
VGSEVEKSGRIKEVESEAEAEGVKREVRGSNSVRQGKKQG